jgi:hypothetical protein
MPEIECGNWHSNVEDAIACARKNLGLTRDVEHPWIGTKTNKLLNKGLIIGCSDITGLRRWRVDWSPEKKMHVNEEDVSEKWNPKKVCHIVHLASEEWKWLMWRKLTSAGREGYENPPVLGSE